jgi:hypothetical protein
VVTVAMHDNKIVAFFEDILTKVDLHELLIDFGRMVAMQELDIVQIKVEYTSVGKQLNP